MRIQSQRLSFQSQHSILWAAVAAIAALYGAFTLSWVIYRVHLPGIVTGFGFSADLAPALLLVEALLAIALEPLSGAASDYTKQTQRTRFPLISLGVILTSVFFVVIPALLAFVEPTESIRWLMPAVLIAWAIAMSLFRSPALALLGRCASAVRLPQAASLITLAAGLAGAAAPLASKFILSLGIPLTSVFSAILLLATAAGLRHYNPIDAAPSEQSIEADATKQRYSALHMGLIAVIGLGATLTFRLAIETFPKLLKAQVAGINPPSLVGLVFVVVALAALPAGALAVRWGNRKTMLLGAATMAIALALMTTLSGVTGAIALAVLLGLSFSLITNGTLPLTLALLPQRQAGLAVGLFFAGASLATSLFIGVLGKPEALSINSSLILAVAMLALTSACIAASRPQPI